MKKEIKETSAIEEILESNLEEIKEVKENPLIYSCR